MRISGMISGRGVSPVDAGRLAVTAPLQHLQADRSRNVKGPATDCRMLDGDHQATGTC